MTFLLLFRYPPPPVLPQKIPRNSKERSKNVIRIFSGYRRKDKHKKTKWYILEFIWDATGIWSISNNNTELTLNSPEVTEKLNVSTFLRSLEF